MLQMLDRLYLTDAGLETDMVFNRGIDLPHFSSVTLLTNPTGQAAHDDYFVGFLELAKAKGTGCLLESATWRASSDWAEALGLSPDELDTLNTLAVKRVSMLAKPFADDGLNVLISGCVGPRGDGYDPGNLMSAEEAEAYHSRQIAALKRGNPDLVSAITMTNIPEAIGIARAARAAGLPVVISFTVETDGRLPTGETLEAAVTSVDQETGSTPLHYMVNCAHPDHFRHVLTSGGDWVQRVRGIRANASRCSHAELDAMTSLDRGDPAELGATYASMRRELPQLRVLGGCCGTDLEHVAAIAGAVEL